MVFATKNWEAQLILTLPSPPVLNVKGTVEVPTPAYEAKLVKPDDALQDSTLVLEVKTKPDNGIVLPKVIDPQDRDVEYQELSFDFRELEQVKVLVPDDEPVVVPIQKVH